MYRPKDRDEGSEMEDDHEEEFYYTEVELGLHASSPPTLSHRDMARPPHEGRPTYHSLAKYINTIISMEILRNCKISGSANDQNPSCDKN